MTIIVPPTPASRDIASVTTDLEKRLKTVEAGLRTVQLNNTSLMGSGFDIYDGNGIYRGTFGVQPDGVVAFISTNNPAPPPIPAKLTATPAIASVIVSHSGETDTGIAWPGDATHFNIYYKEVVSPGDPTIAGTITPIINGAGGSLVVGPLLGGEYEFTATAVNLSGKESAPSVPVVATPDQVVNEETLAEIIADLQTNEGIVTEAMLAANAVTETKISPNSVNTPHIIAGAIQTSQIAANAINAGHIISGEVTTRHLRALSITGDKIDINQINAGHIKAGAITALKLEANMVLASRIICGVPSGNRVELHPTLGIVGYTQDGVKRTFWIDSTTGNVTAVGKWSTGFDGERAIIDTDGTITFIDSANFVSGKIINDGTNGIFFRARWDDDFNANTSFLFLSRFSCYIGYGKPGQFTGAFSCDAAGIQSWGRLVGIRYESRWAGDGTQPRLFILATSTSGADIGNSVLHVIKRTIDNYSAIVAPIANSGILFYGGEMNVVGGNPTVWGPIRASAHLLPSSEVLKRDIGEISLPDGRTEWDIIEGAPALDWKYLEDETNSVRPDKPKDAGGRPIKLRTPDSSSPDGWSYVDAGWDSPPRPKRVHKGPLAEDLAALSPGLVVGSTDDPRQMATDLRDLLGVAWGAIDKLIKRQRILEQLLVQRLPNLNLPPLPQKGDVSEGVGTIVPGRTQRQIDPATGQVRGPNDQQ